MKDWQWRPYQGGEDGCFAAIVQAYKKGITQQLIVQATGLGKRSQAVFMAGKGRNSLFLAHTEELIQQAYDDFVKWYGEENVGVIRGNKMEIDKRFVVSSPLTIVNRLDRIDSQHFDIVQLDECFTAGTMIGDTKIEDLRIGDLVDSYNHDLNTVEKRKVLSLFKNEIKGLLYKLTFSNGESFVCTENHPVFIKDNGYIMVSKLLYLYRKKQSHELLSSKVFKLYCMWKVTFSKICKFKIQNLFKRMYRNCKDRKLQKFQKVSCSDDLQRMRNSCDRRYGKKSKRMGSISFNGLCLLFAKMQKIKLWTNSKKNNESNKQNSLFCKDERTQSNEQSRNRGENEAIQYGKNFFKSWWKRSINKATEDNSQNDRSSNGICNYNKRTNFFRSFITILLQGRFGMSRGKIGGRNRWKNTSDKKVEVLGQTKNGGTQFFRLDSIKIYERKDQQGIPESDERNYAYNFEVENNNNYFANGVLVHNCHHFMSRMFYKAATHFNARLRIGWTATPRRLDGLSLMDLFQERTFEYGILQGIKDGYLAELKGIRIKTNVSLNTARKSMGDFNATDLENLVDIEARNDLIVDSYIKYAEGRQFIVFTVSTEHSQNVVAAFAKKGIEIGILSADKNVCPDREGVISEFKSGRLIGFSNVVIATEGFDYSEVGAILDAAPTMSESRYLQRIGRGTRIKSLEFQERFGNNCLIMDFVDLSSRHKLVNSFELDQKLPAGEKVFVTTEQREKLLDAEKKRRESKILSVVENDEYFDLAKPPRIKVSNSEKMMEEATPAQIKLLSWLGLYEKFDLEGHEIEYTKKNVSELLQSEILPWMKKKMIDWKYNPTGATMAQYLAISNEMRINNERAEIEAAQERMRNKLVDSLSGNPELF